MKLLHLGPPSPEHRPHEYVEEAMFEDADGNYWWARHHLREANPQSREIVSRLEDAALRQTEDPERHAATTAKVGTHMSAGAGEHSCDAWQCPLDEWAFITEVYVGPARANEKWNELMSAALGTVDGIAAKAMLVL
jgi:hypothetical protein